MDVGPVMKCLCLLLLFLATYEAVMEVGAIPVMVDIDDNPQTLIQRIEKKKNAVHQGGNSRAHCGSGANIDKIVEIAHRNKLLCFGR